MKQFLISITLFTFLLSACTKSDNTLPYNSWTIDNQQYQALNVSRPAGPSMILATDGSGINGNRLSLYFSAPPASGSYKIVALPAAADEMGILVQNGGITRLLRGVSSQQGTADVVVRNGRATILLNRIALQPVLPLQNGGAVLNAVIKE